MKGARSLFHEHLLALDRSDAGVDGPELFVALVNDLDRDFAVPQPHVRVRILPVGDLVAGRDVDDGMSVFSAGFEKALDARDDLVVDMLTGERIARSGPGVGKIDVNQRGLSTEPDASLKPALGV